MITGGRPGGGSTPDKITCVSCGADAAPTNKFCGECGARLTGIDASAEYKQVTLLFVDVVRSMDLAAALDMERLREVMTDVVERSADVLRRYGGTVEHHGDGVMAIFGAPIALEDHALRACVAALAVQKEIGHIADKVQLRDGVGLQVRVGLNSGPVIAGQIGSGSLGYRATGEHVGMAQRMESVAPPGGVMLSESTVRLVGPAVTLGEPEWKHIKGAAKPLRAWQLLAVTPRQGAWSRTEAALVGRSRELSVLGAMLNRAIGRSGAVVQLTGPPGIGKSRTARELATRAESLGIEVCWSFCESHTSDVAFHAVTRLLRSALRLTDLGAEAARLQLRAVMPDADSNDLLLLEDLLGIAESEVPVPQIDPEVRRRRITGLINNASLRREKPALYIIEDVHWIDTVSESMLALFLDVIPSTASMVLITHRPEYRGLLRGVNGAQTLTLAPLDDADIAAMVRELVGSDPSVGALTGLITERAAGNPFFAEEMVRELVQRGVLSGNRGRHVCDKNVTEISVPATVLAAVEARIDGQLPAAKRTLRAAAVLGVRFRADLLAAMDVEPVLDELIDAELIDRVGPGDDAEYVFRHPLIRAVAYESQLKSDRAGWHRLAAVAVEQSTDRATDEHAALIAEHVEHAGDFAAAYHWHMRAGAWLTNRDLAAARASWERARRLADQLSDDESDVLSMRIGPRTMLCATDLQAREAHESEDRFAELRRLCRTTGDKVSLAIGMSGPATALMFAGRVREASQLSSEQMALLASIDDPTPLMALASVAFCNWLGVLRFDEIVHWSQAVVDLADGDPTKGASYGIGSPLAVALGWRGTAKWCLRLPGWRDDLHGAVEMARHSNTETLSGTIAWTYGFAMQYGVLRADHGIRAAAEEAVGIARCASNDRALGLAGYTLAVALLSQDDDADRLRGLELMAEVRELWSRRGIFFLIPITDMWLARETARHGDRDAAVGAMRQATVELHRGYPFYGVWADVVLAETLLDRRAEGDLLEARAAVDRLSHLAKEHDSVMVEIALLRIRVLSARAQGDTSTVAELAPCYLDRAESLGFEGHIDSARSILSDLR
ncbi:MULTISPECIES: adenylate/guanylate cyclase domain-containing protein [Mycobacteriaceae]|uniref:AAA family ATPase n=1 Tax=Mycolicibacterium parafortuitum TaxID=39692 RepID=A0ACC6MLW0_MYCPF|nr:MULTISPECIES: adenylate/guanylate cyclase domain-containing protein [Mycobacteriaceae]MDZ5087939.1 AAA family ATPase [Mycolicibacterium parafortuitum]GFM16384.1 adenylate/guanylate cyclase family protein [Mycobacterium sp. PO1]GFM25929.1 adenylate/guanylate cyclase family protein [Mycobacterium sp. PO2]